MNDKHQILKNGYLCREKMRLRRGAWALSTVFVAFESLKADKAKTYSAH